MCSEEKRRRGRRGREEGVCSELFGIRNRRKKYIREVLYSIQNNIAVGSMKQEVHHFQSIPAHAPVMHFFR